tara:strand:- start:1656 stop:2360 length:705 start_codon:yes stop_codon:yes gene_type:complete
MLDNLEQYFMTNNNIIEWTNNIVEQHKYKRNDIMKSPKKPVIKKDLPYLHINKKDGLFWAFYYMLNGEFSYMTIHNVFSTEKLEKINYVQTIRENKAILKKYKLKSTYIEDQLLNTPVIDIKTFFILCVLNNISFIVYNKHFYWKHICSSNIFIINNQEKDVYLYTGTTMENEKENVTKNRLEVINVNKVIGSISSYKMIDLKEICDKLNINMFHTSGKKKKKQEIYQELIQLI